MAEVIHTTLSFRAAVRFGVAHMAGQMVVLTRNEAHPDGWDVTCQDATPRCNLDSPASCREQGGLPDGHRRYWSKKRGIYTAKPQWLRRRHVRSAGFDGQPEILRAHFDA